MDERPGLPLELSRVLPAPRARVFAMLTEPAELARWWGPRGFTMPAAEVDLRVGGGYRLTMQPPDGDPFHLGGEFVEIDPPRRLGYTFRYEEATPDDRETTVALTLEARGDTTEVSLSQSGFATEERVALHRDGWIDSFERLREVLATDS
ncbi:MAG: SRPBCC family protein [Nocardioidaceae bacterium]